jgi:hypothetical protein
LLVASAVLLAAIRCGTAYAHGAGVPFALWGNTFTPPDTQCQRVIGRAASVCAVHMWTARDACWQAQLAGETCDPHSSDATLQTARVQALNTVDLFCSDRLVGDLGFLGLFEVQGDLGNFWSSFDDAMLSAVYGPLDGGGLRLADSKTQRCVGSAARAARKLVRFAFAAQVGALDRIARGGFTPQAKEGLVQRAATRVARARQVLADQMALHCSDAEFASVYERSIATFLEGIAQRADCLAGAAYVQSRVVCPAPVCGNGVKEPGEMCADGKY